MTQAVELSDIGDLKLEISELRGEIKTLSAEYRAGDRNGEAGVRLLAQQVKVNADGLAEQRADIKMFFAEMRSLIEATRSDGQTAASTVRVDVERQLEVHRNEDAPHARTLGTRLDALETEAAELRGRSKVLTWLGGTLGTALIVADVGIVVKVFSGS